MEEHQPPSEKKRRIEGEESKEDEEDFLPGRVFVGNLPPPNVYMVTPELFTQWFDAQMRDRVNDADRKIRLENGGPPLKDDERFIAGIERFSAEEGCCFVKIKRAYEVQIALRVSGSTYKGNQLSVTLPQCLPDPTFMSFPTATDQPIPSVYPALNNWRGKYVVFSEMPLNTTEADIRSLFEALGGPLESLWTYKEDGFFKGCGRLAFVNTLVNESVVQKLNGAPVGNNVLRIASLLPEAIKAGGGSASGSAVDAFNQSVELPTVSVSAQLFFDPVIALQMRSGRNMGANPTRIVQLLNIVKIEDLLCPVLYDELIEEIKKEASRYGKLESVLAPKPDRKGTIHPSTGCGKVFLEYTDTTAARKAQFELNGRLFDNRVVCASFYPLLAFQMKQYSLLVP